MKKAVIKRRKRVIPAAGGAQDTENGSVEPADSPVTDTNMTMERGSVNADGSINLGLRKRTEALFSLVPEEQLWNNRQASPSSGNLNQYHSTPQHQQMHIPDSLTNENRLAPIKSMGGPVDRQSSLSPASFLSPSRKRSVSAADMDAPGSNEGEHNKRLSSIKSILNPTSSDSGYERSSDHLRPHMRSPGSTSTSIPSPGAYSASGATQSPTLLPIPPTEGSGESNSEADRLKAERRAALEREAEKMRELLAAKERELAELADE